MDTLPSQVPSLSRNRERFGAVARTGLSLFFLKSWKQHCVANSSQSLVSME